MNFYKHHIGDFAQATAHLSFVEDAAYSRMIRKYYAEEKPLPLDLKAVQRLVGARTREEKCAVELVLQEFFLAGDDGWHNKRCDAELYQANAQAETNRRIAEEREAKRRARTEHDSLNGSSHASLNESSTLSGVPRAEVVNLARLQTPDSRLQTPEKKKAPAGPKKPPKKAPPDDFEVSERVRTWAQERGFDHLQQHLEAFLRKCKANGYAYADWDSAFMEAIREDWAKLRGRTANGAAPPPESPPAAQDWTTTRDGVQGRAYQLGIGPYEELDHSTGRGISWASYRSRVIAAHNTSLEGHLA